MSWCECFSSSSEAFAAAAWDATTAHHPAPRPRRFSGMGPPRTRTGRRRVSQQAAACDDGRHHHTTAGVSSKFYLLQSVEVGNRQRRQAGRTSMVDTAATFAMSSLRQASEQSIRR